MPVAPYTHTALFHETDDELVDALVPWVVEGIEADETVVVVMSAPVGNELRQRLGSAEGYVLLDSADLYTFPMRTLGAYIETVRAGNEHGRAIRVAGQPIWSGRSSLEVTEWTCVEAACNVVFADSRLTMLCPYDTARLDPAIVAAARRTHPVIRRGVHATPSTEFAPVVHRHAVHRSALDPAPSSRQQIAVSPQIDVVDALDFVHAWVQTHALSGDRSTHLRSTVHELLTDVFDGLCGPVAMQLWTTSTDLICQLHGPSRAVSPFAGYVPDSDATVWAAGQRCDLVAVRSDDTGTTIRLHINDFFVESRASCDGIDRLLGVYVMDACEPVEAVLVEAHVATCDNCRAEVDRLSAVIDKLAGDDPL